MKTLNIKERAWLRVPCSEAPRISYGPDRVERLIKFSLRERLFGHCWIRADRHDSVRGLRIVRCYTEAEYRDYWIDSMVAALAPFGNRVAEDILDRVRTGITQTEVARLKALASGDDLLYRTSAFLFRVFGKELSPVEALYKILLKFVGTAYYLEITKSHIMPQGSSDDAAHQLIEAQRTLPGDFLLYRQDEMMQRIFLAAYFKAPMQSKIVSQLLQDLVADGGSLSDYPKVVR